MTAHGTRRLTLAFAASLLILLGQRALAQGPATPTESVTVAPSTAAPSSAWQAVPGADRGFAAEMPAAPKYSSVEMKTNSGSNYAMHQFLLELGDTAYVVQTAVYPDDVNVSNPRINLQGGLDNAAKNMDGGKWASVDWLTHQGSTASDAVGVRAGNAVRTFSVMKGRQIFTLTYAGPPGTARSADVNRFVGSLRVGP